MYIQKKYDFQRKLSVLAEGDKLFVKELTRLYIINFQELRHNFRMIMLDQDQQALAFMHHKYRTTFLMFDLMELATEVEKGKKLLETTTINALEMHQLISNVEKSCDEILSELHEVEIVSYSRGLINP